MFLAETKWLSRLRQTSESSRCHILIARRNEITRKVVVVNDDQLLRASMAGSLGANEYEVSTASDGYDALWQLKHGLVDLVNSDLEIPGMPGVSSFPSFGADSLKYWSLHSMKQTTARSNPRWRTSC